MDRLGFFMDTNGNITYFGTWKEIRDLNDPSQNHYSSFENDVESKEEFQSLHLDYVKGASVLIKAISFAVQGMVTLTNGSDGYNNQRMHMYVPRELTDAQKEKLAELYDMLSSFEEVYIQICTQEHTVKQEVFDDVDKYFEANSISKGQRLA